ncbi:MAG: hypothetical protein KDI03_09660, partial [Anaerolineae bacterium]|nr:hypothetical protein [Anaerolineae bacterium]
SLSELWAPSDKWVGVIGFSYASPDDVASAGESQTQQLVYWAVAVEGNSCRLYRSEDGGVIWQPQTLYKSVYLPAVRASSVTTE